MKHAVTNERGITLVELMIVVFTGGLLSVMAMGTLLNISGTSSSMSINLDAETDEIQAANAMQMTFGQATQLQFFGGGDLNGYSDTNGVGVLRTYDSDAEFGAFPPVNTLAVFMRDAANSSENSPSTVSSQLTPTAVFFQKPTPTTWGVLYISLGGGPLQPSRADLFYEGIVRVRILNVSTFSPSSITPVVGAPITSFDLEITFRRFIGDVRPEGRMFCPASSINLCPGIGSFKDVSRILKITARNNILTESPTSPFPRKGARMYDLVHFFGLGRKGGLR